MNENNIKTKTTKIDNNSDIVGIHYLCKKCTTTYNSYLCKFNRNSNNCICNAGWVSDKLRITNVEYSDNYVSGWADNIYEEVFIDAECNLEVNEYIDNDGRKRILLQLSESNIFDNSFQKYLYNKYAVADIIAPRIDSISLVLEEGEVIYKNVDIFKEELTNNGEAIPLSLQYEEYEGPGIMYHYHMMNCPDKYRQFYKIESNIIYDYNGFDLFIPSMIDESVKNVPVKLRFSTGRTISNGEMIDMLNKAYKK